MPKIELDITDEELAGIRQLLVKLQQPMWKSMIPKHLVTLVRKIEHAVRKDK